LFGVEIGVWAKGGVAIELVLDCCLAKLHGGGCVGERAVVIELVRGPVWGKAVDEYQNVILGAISFFSGLPL
jgi:hypothetical protein